ncbi:MAG: SHOCT domain-containing protein [Nitrosopumilus sp.]
MNKNDYRSYSFGLTILLMLTAITPAFAEVKSLQTDNELFYVGDQIKFLGTVEPGDRGLVTIVIRDLNDEFVMLTQALINYDDSFEKTIKITDKFSEHGIYNATGFILNMTQGITTNFGISIYGEPIILYKEKTENTFVESSKMNEELIIEKENVINKSQMESKIQKTTAIVDFVDKSKDPRYYIDRYYNEKSYKSWFDRNYPGLTIKEAVGYTGEDKEIKATVEEVIEDKIIPEAQASSIVEPIKQSKNNPETAQILLAIAGLGILFGAVYGVKRQVDSNSKQISINRDTLRKKIIRPIIGTNPKEILQTRLVKGEITLEEYEKIKSKLD